MNNNHRVLNVSRGFTLKHKQALRAIDNCAAAWVEIGKTIRDLTLAEAISARNKQATQREPLEFTEVHGLRYEPAASGIAQTREGFGLSREANRFYLMNEIREWLASGNALIDYCRQHGKPSYETACEWLQQDNIYPQAVYGNGCPMLES